MPTLIASATRVQGAGSKPIVIDEYIGRVNSGHEKISIAYLVCPGEWIEPAQTPDFDEFTIVLRGVLRVASNDGDFDVKAGQAIITRRGERVQYSTPGPEEAHYVAVCLPAFSLDAAHRET